MWWALEWVVAGGWVGEAGGWIRTGAAVVLVVVAVEAGSVVVRGWPLLRVGGGNQVTCCSGIGWTQTNKFVDRDAVIPEGRAEATKHTCVALP